MFLRKNCPLALRHLGRRHASQAQEVVTKEKIDLAKPTVVKWKRPPFLKNFFQGKFDTELLAFPEILNKEELSELETHVSNIGLLMKEKVNSMEIDKKREISDDFLQSLKDLGLFGRMIPAKYGGLDLTYTACTRINEVLGLDWSISSTLAAHEFLATQVILKFGSDAQKSFYLPQLATGSLIAACCCTEFESGSDLLSLKTRAVETADGKYLLSGSKCWVANAQTAELFVVFAKTSSSMDPKVDEVSVFLVKKGEGVHVFPQDTISLRGLNTGMVHFDEVVIPSSNVIGTLGNGFQVYLKALESFRIASSTFTFGALKSLLDSVITNLTHKERVNKSLADYELVRMRLSRINAMIYGMESAAYFTAAILDSTEDPDMSLEAAALKIFCSEATLFCLEELGRALGATSLSPETQLERFHRDAQALAMFDSPNDMCRLFLGLYGCQAVGARKQEVITHVRNPFYFPREVTKRAFRHWKIRRHMFKFDQDIAGHIHPSLLEWGNELEKKLQLFEISVEEVLAASGRKVVELQIDPIRLANVATELYVWSAVLSRASRSYCIGLKNSHHEIRLAEAYCYDANERVEDILKDILEGLLRSNDKNHLLLGEQLIDCQGYFAEHPLRHNF